MQPRLRPDIIIHAYDESQGSGAIVLEDPVARKYFRISPYELELLKVLDGKRNLEQIIERLRLHGRYFNETHIAKLLDQYSRAGLLLGTSYGNSKTQFAWKRHFEREAKQRSLAKLYYAYIPLLNPDRFLSYTLPFFRFFIRPITGIMLVLLAIGAAYLLVIGLDRFQAEYLFFFNLENLFVLWIAIAIVKLVHEFSHGYTAKHFGLHVPEMGIALLIFFPCLYCNTTAAWQLADKKQRITIAAAGIISEIVLAVFAIYIWFFTHPGLLNSIAFYLAAISLISSLLFNGNPLLKFDGYFILSDILGIPNLQSKAFGYLRYLFFNRVLGIISVHPVQAESRDHILFVIYGIMAYVYRFTLYFGIVIGVYLRFDKIVGLILGAMWLVVFVGKPLIRSFTNVWKKHSEVSFQPKGLLVVFGLMIILFILITRPWSSHSSYPCFLRSAEIRQITLTANAPVENVFVRMGDKVTKDQTILTLNPIPLQFLLKEKETELLRIKKEIELIEATEKDLGRLDVKLIELSQAQDALDEVKRDLQMTSWTAPFDGYVTKLHSVIQTGAQPGKGTIVGEISRVDSYEVVGIVPESDISNVKPGTLVKVSFACCHNDPFVLKVAEVANFKTEDLEASSFSSRFGGEIATEAKPDGARDVPLEPFYLCKIPFDNTSAVPLGTTGRMLVNLPPQNLLTRVRNKVYNTFYKEVVF